MRLFLNPKSSVYLSGLAEEFDESTNSVRLELNRLETAGLLVSEVDGNKKVFKANVGYPLFSEGRNIVLKHTGLQEVIDNVVQELGGLSEVYLTGDLAIGKQSEIVSLILVGGPDQSYLIEFFEKVEKLISKRIQYLICSRDDAVALDFETQKYLLLWHEQFHETYWTAFYTKPRNEKKAAERLMSEGFDIYCPTRTVIK